MLRGSSPTWAPRAGVIRDRLIRLPIETTVLIVGDTESHTRRDAPKGAAAITWATCTALGLEIEPVDDVEAALRRAELVVAFHPQITMSRATGQVVDRAKELGLAVEVITGRPTELPTKGRLRRAQQEAAR